MQEKLVLISIPILIGLGIFLLARIRNLHENGEVALVGYCGCVGVAAIVTGILLAYALF